MKVYTLTQPVNYKTNQVLFVIHHLGWYDYITYFQSTSTL